MTSPAHETVDRPLAGIAANTLAFAAISAGDSLSKLVLAFASIPQMVALRSVLIILFISPLFIAEWRRGAPILRTRRPLLHLARIALQCVSVVTFFIAMKELPLTTVTAIMFIAPSLVALASAPILREPIRPPQVVALALGSLGCLLILRPSGEAGQATIILIALVAAATWALSLTLLRLLTRTESQATILAWNNGAFLLFGGAFAIFDWRPIEPGVLLIIVVMAVTQVVGQWFSMMAYRIARAATIAPMQYTQLLWAALFGAILFDEWPQPSVWAGAALIIAGGLYLVWAEGRREPPRLAPEAG